MSAQTNSFDFLDQIYPKKLFPVKKRKSEHHPGIVHTWISLSTKFQLKPEFMFLDQIYPKRAQQNKITSPINYKCLFFV